MYLRIYKHRTLRLAAVQNEPTFAATITARIDVTV